MNPLRPETMPLLTPSNAKIGKHDSRSPATVGKIRQENAKCWTFQRDYGLNEPDTHDKTDIEKGMPVELGEKNLLTTSGKTKSAILAVDW